MTIQSPTTIVPGLTAARDELTVEVSRRPGSFVVAFVAGTVLAACTRPTFAVSGTVDASPEGGKELNGATLPDGADGGVRVATEPVSPVPAGGGLGAAGGRLGTDGGGAVSDAGNVDLPSITLADASVDTGTADVDDAAVAADWSRALEGSFARQIVSYGFAGDAGLLRTTTVLALSTIGPADAGGLELYTEACRIDYEWPTAMGMLVDTGMPRAGSATMRQAIRVGREPQFALERSVLRFGFDTSRNADCTPGDYRVRYGDQSWLYALPCRCPAQPQTLPSTANDCRLTDTDGDLQPGFTLVERSTSWIEARYALAIELAFYGGTGRLAPDAVPMVDERSVSAMGCVNAALDGCGGSPPMSCEVTHTDFARLEGKAPSCADVLTTGLTRLAKPPVPPDSCPVAADVFHPRADR
jgi:hypothetical protein